MLTSTRLSELTPGPLPAARESNLVTQGVPVLTRGWWMWRIYGAYALLRDSSSAFNRSTDLLFFDLFLTDDQFRPLETQCNRDSSDPLKSCDDNASDSTTV